MPLWKKGIIGSAIVALLFANPYTRAAVLWLLPLGSGLDDLIEMVALVILTGLLVARGLDILAYDRKRRGNR